MEKFINRMKFLATLPENKDAIFNIPVGKISFSSCILTDDQIDQYIRMNGLIVHSKKDNEEMKEESILRDENTTNKAVNNFVSEFMSVTTTSKL
jgi:hypothetical protein